MKESRRKDIMSNSFLEVCGVRCYEEDDVAYLHIEDVARGLGFTTKVNETEYVRWQRVDEYLGELGFLPQVANEENPHDYYIPENIFYRLCMKANNAFAKNFQKKVANEVLPKLRKHGVYMTDNVLEQTLNNPDFLISILQEYKKEKAEKEKAIAERDEAIRTRTLYQSGLASEMSGRVGGLQKSNNSLRKENSELKDAVGRGCNWRTIGMMKAEWIKEFGHIPSWQKLKQFSEDVGIPPVHDVEEKVVLKNGSEKVSVSYRYHKEAWARYKKYEENLRVTPDEVSLV